MRILLSEGDKKKVFNFLKEKNNCKSLKELSSKLKISFNTLQTWVYNKGRYLPKKIIPADIHFKIKIIDEKEDNWGSIKGGKKTYKKILKLYGVEEIIRRQKEGGRISKELKLQNEKPFEIDISNPSFLEFYGVLLGDGWISKLHYKNKLIWLIGISGNRHLDKDFFLYLKKNIYILFNRTAYLKDRPKHNSIELNFSHKTLVKFFNEELHFPIGKKINLEIPKEIYNLGYDKVKNIIRGIFDTDGSFYFDKTPANRPYPCISICMKAPILMNQIYSELIRQGFKVYFNNSREAPQIKLKGDIQLRKWMNEIGSSNPYKYNKMIARVAQSG